MQSVGKRRVCNDRHVRTHSVNRAGSAYNCVQDIGNREETSSHTHAQTPCDTGLDRQLAQPTSKRHEHKHKTGSAEPCKHTHIQSHQHRANHAKITRKSRPRVKITRKSRENHASFELPAKSLARCSELENPTPGIPAKLRAQRAGPFHRIETQKYMIQQRRHTH